MKILILTFDYKPIIGGQGIYVNEMEHLMRKGNEVIIDHSDGKLRMGFGPLFYTKRLFWRSASLIKKHNPDIIHVQSGPGGVQFIRKCRVPVVLTAHHTYNLSMKHKSALLFPYFCLMKFMEKISFCRADHIIAISDLVKKDIIEGYGIASDKITVIHNGYNETIFSHPKNPRREKKVIFAGRVERQKGIRQLTEAMSRFKDYSLEIIGNGSYKKEMIEYSKSLGVNLSTTEMISQKELAERFRTAAAVAMPSDFEAFGLTAIEALACGTPAFCTRNCGCSEMISRIDKKLVIEDNSPKEIAEAISHCIKKKQVNAKLPTWKDTYEDTIKVFKKCIR